MEQSQHAKAIIWVFPESLKWVQVHIPRVGLCEHFLFLPGYSDEKHVRANCLGLAFL